MRTIAIGIQNFGKIIENNYFYVDKTDFIVQWWKSGDDVTLIARPRRFGKTLNMSMLKYYFDCRQDNKELFKELKIMSQDEKYTKLSVVIYEGQNRQVRRMFEAIGKNIHLLKRVRIGSVRLGGLKRGDYRDMTEEELNSLVRPM